MKRRTKHSFADVGADRLAQAGSAKPKPGRLRQDLWSLLLALGSAALQGCATSTHQGNGLLDQALGMVGLQRTSMAATTDDASRAQPTPPQKATNRVTLRVHAAQVLNLSAAGASLPVVLRLYKLKDRSIFEQMPYTAFSRTQVADFGSFAADIAETREMVFLPGQRYEVVETLEPNVRFIAVVALFRSPSPQRWRAIFDVPPATAVSPIPSITLGLHGCAISVATGQALGMPPELTRVAGVRCDGGPE
ncbi:type VI secretion system lipoprotein TssJ [Azohydromonas lata]|uniref:Type VI secretion system lipoprotein TssJ n=1 Tax=Azohydromonas lata TaxID=45677 RepID=A0ABU5IAL0_9BURK|nr:type VI secretion system lipoprotein TssJ [Azohydromonas lata]MDZ5456008.1 type VI secretion system lipoprotein TssJ [Azohydromonas lata]